MFLEQMLWYLRVPCFCNCSIDDSWMKGVDRLGIGVFFLELSLFRYSRGVERMDMGVVWRKTCESIIWFISLVLLWKLYFGRFPQIVWKISGFSNREFLSSERCLNWTRRGNLGARNFDNLVLYAKRVCQITVSKGGQSLFGLELL